MSHQFLPLGLNFPEPTSNALTVDLNARQQFHLILAALNNLYAQLQADESAPKTAAPAQRNVTDTASSIVSASAGGKLVIITNNGSNPCRILPGGTAVFANAGILMEPGDYWESPAPIKSAISAICDTGKSTTLTVIELT